MKNYFDSRRMPQCKSGRRRQKVDPAAIGWALRDVINNNTKVQMAACNFGISKH